MLSIGRHTDYAARLVLHVAALGNDAQVTIREVSEERLLPTAFARRLVASLTQAGILATVRGASGGIRLARPASDISLLDVVEAMEGPVALSRCVPGAEGCPLAGMCPVHCVWHKINMQLRDSLGSVRFDTLARSPEHVAAHLKIHASTPPSPKAPRPGVPLATAT